jgi:hypothetical protein
MGRNVLIRVGDLDSEFRLSHCRHTDKRRLKIRVSVVRFRPWAPSQKIALRLHAASFVLREA